MAKEVNNIEMIAFTQSLMELGAVKINGKDNPDVLDIMKLRTSEFYDICKEFNKIPTWTGLALAYGITRATLTTWRDAIPEWTRGSVSEFIQQQWAALNSFHESGMLEGTIPAVPGIFIGKNNFGYINEDQQTVVHEISGHWSAEKLIEGAKSLQLATKE